MNKNTLAIIPARGGSKRVQNKNIRQVGGKPLISHTIEQAQKSDVVDRSIISTDDEQIIKTSKRYGGDVPFQRPDELATDTSSMSDVVTHAVEWIKKQDNTDYDVVCVLQPTVPLRSSADISNTIKKLVSSNAESALSVSKYRTPPQWAVTADNDGFLSEYFESGLLWGENPKRSQDIPELSHPNGAIFAATLDAWKSNKSFYTSKTVGYEMPPERSFDIDEPWELELVQKLMS